MKSEIVKVTYSFRIRYENKEHLSDIKKELREGPVYQMGGAGVAEDGEVYSYSCSRIGKGSIVKKG